MKTATIRRLLENGVSVVVPYNNSVKLPVLEEAILSYTKYSNISFVHKRHIDGDDNLIVDFFCVYDDNKYVQNVFFSDEGDVPPAPQLSGYTMIIEDGLWSRQAELLSHTAQYSDLIDVIKLEVLQL